MTKIKEGDWVMPKAGGRPMKVVITFGGIVKVRRGGNYLFLKESEVKRCRR